MSRRTRLSHLAFAAVAFAGGWGVAQFGPVEANYAPAVHTLRTKVDSLREIISASDRGRRLWERRDSAQAARIALLLADRDQYAQQARSASRRLARALDSLQAPAHVLADASALAGACEGGLTTCDSIHAADSTRIAGRDSLIAVLVPQRDSAYRLADSGASLSAAIERQRAAAIRQRNAALVATVVALILGALK